MDIEYGDFASSSLYKLRFLQDSNNSTNSTSTDEPNDAQILRGTFVVYGSILAVSLFAFCIVRLLFRRPYTVRRWDDDLKVGGAVLRVYSIPHVKDMLT